MRKLEEHQKEQGFQKHSPKWGILEVDAVAVLARATHEEEGRKKHVVKGWMGVVTYLWPSRVLTLNFV